MPDILAVIFHMELHFGRNNNISIKYFSAQIKKYAQTSFFLSTDG